MTNLSITNTYDWQVYPGSKSLDREVQEHWAEFSRSRCARLIEEGWVLLDGAQAKPSTLVRSGQRIHVIIPSPVPVEVTPQKMSISVVYEDSDYSSIVNSVMQWLEDHGYLTDWSYSDDV